MARTVTADKDGYELISPYWVKKWPILDKKTLQKTNLFWFLPTYLLSCDRMIHATQDSNCVTDDVTSKHASVLIYDAAND